MSKRRDRAFVVVLSVLSAAAGCGPRAEPPRPGGEPAVSVPEGSRSAGRRPSAAPSLVFRAQELPFRYERGESGSAWPVEVTGGGVGLLDFDGDGDLDLFFAQGVPLPVGREPAPPADVLLKNNGAGRFEDVSARVGLISKGYGQGVAVADFDADGDPDVHVTRYGPDTLWRNDGGRFSDVTAEAGVGCPLWGLGAAFLDFDADGDLDLYVANYFHFDPAEAPFARDERGQPDQGMPTEFPGLPDVLYRNDGKGRFTDVSRSAGLGADVGRGMGVLASDLDDDGRIDVFVANDAMANSLWRNQGDGTFEDVALDLGLAYNGEGNSEANMGIARGDTDGDGLPDVVVTHFFDEHVTLWRATRLETGLAYHDMTREAGIAVDSRPMTSWGVVLADFDHDGHLDLMATCGHLRREPRQVYHYENPPLLWRNDGRGRFVSAAEGAGPYFQARHVGRGLAAGDLDDDGDLDLVVVHHHAPSVVLWNETPRRGASLLVRPRGRAPNLDALGARLVATVGGRKLVRSIDGGGSYLSASDRRVHFGLGDAPRVDRLEVRWPSGRVEVKTDVPAGGTVEWVEGDGPGP